MRTSFHHQPEAQHPKSPAIHKPAGRLPHLFLQKSGQSKTIPAVSLLALCRRSRLKTVWPPPEYRPLLLPSSD